MKKHLLLFLLPLAACRAPQPEPAAPPPPQTAPPAAPLETEYTWFRLAELAAANSWEIRSLAGEAQAERLWGITRAQTRDPRLLGLYDRSSGSAWEDRLAGHRSADDSSYSAGGRLRIYTSNPFVNRHLRAEGTGRAEELIGKAAAVKHDLTEDALLLCIEIHRLEQERTLAAETERLREALLQRTQRAAEAALVTFYEVARDELALENTRAANREREVRITSLRRELAALCAIPVEHLRITPPAIDLPTLSANLPPAADLYAQAIASHPQLLIARSLKKQAQAQIDTARATQIPWFEYVDAGYGRARGTGTETTAAPAGATTLSGSDQSSEWQIRAAVTIPVFSWFSSAGRQARLRLQAAQAREHALFEHIHREINGLRADLLAASAAYTQALQTFADYETRLHSRIAPLRQATFADQEAFLKLELDELEVKTRLLRMEERCHTVYASLLTTLSRTADMSQAP